MDQTKADPSRTDRCMTIHHHVNGTVLHFHASLWNLFSRSVIFDRFHAWMMAASGPWFRHPSSLQETATGDLILHLPPLPEGYLPLTKVHETLVNPEDKLRLLLSLTEALAHLHQRRFIVGIISPELVSFHPQTLTVCLDIQLYPSAFPLVDNFMADFPSSLLSPFARYHTMPRVADIYAIGLLYQWLLLGQLPEEPGTVAGVLPPPYAALGEQLVTAPERFLAVEEVYNAFAVLLPGATAKQGWTEHIMWSPLHPAAAPILTKQLRQLHMFLRSNGGRLLSMISADEAARYSVYSRHFNEVMERHFFFTIGCKDLPYATMRELIERTILLAAKFRPQAKPKFRSLQLKFEQLLRQHYGGNEIVREMTEWLYHFYREIMPMLQSQSLYYTFEGCERFDEDSQRVFVLFWDKYIHEIKGLHVLFSGKEPPNLIPSAVVRPIELGQKTQEMYQHLLLSQLGRAEEGMLELLSAWFAAQGIDFLYVSLVLEKLIETGQIFLTEDGWQRSPSFAPEASRLTPAELVAERLAMLHQDELELLRILACLPLPVRAGAMFEANGLDTGKLWETLARLEQLSLVRVHHLNSVYIPEEVARQALHQLPAAEKAQYYQKALPLQQRYRPASLPPLIELAKLSGHQRLEYYFLIRYYRQIRNLLLLERRKEMLQYLYRLQVALGRQRVIGLRRHLCQIHLQLNEYDQAEEIALQLYQRTGDLYDRFVWLRVRLFTNRLDLPHVKQELFGYLANRQLRLSDRARAAHLLTFIDFYSPFQKEGALLIDQFYRQEFFPRRMEVSRRLFAEFTLTYTIVLFHYMPEQNEWGNVLRQTLESMLEKSPYPELMVDLYNSYIFTTNVKVAHTYNRRQLEASRRFGFKLKEQVSHLNSMENSLFLGDAAGFRFHMEEVVRVDALKRADLLEQFLLLQQMFACEWEQWDLFEAAGRDLARYELSDSAALDWIVISRYAAYRRKQPLPPPPVWEHVRDSTLLIDALYAIEQGDTGRACQLLQQSIAANRYRIYCGWAMRELLELLLAVQADDTEYWLDQFEHYLKTCGYDLFWPDYYRLAANWAWKKGEVQRALLLLRRAVNIYHLIEKTAPYRQMNEVLERAMQPVLPAEGGQPQDAMLQSLLEERSYYLRQALDLQIIMQLSEQVTESLDLMETLNRLIHALFEYFPITLLAIDYRLFFQQEKLYYRASGMLNKEMLQRFLVQKDIVQRYRFTLFDQGKQAISLEVYAPALADTQREHMEHFLSFIKPHIGNALLYMEMMIDNLTGFYQRRYFLEQLTREFALAKTYDLDLSVIMLDIDNFRLVNEHGHQEGDRVLKETAEIVRSILRKNDIPGRYGGEELLLVLPKTDGLAALQLAREIRKRVEEEFHGRPYQVTVSVGVSSMDRNRPADVDELIRLADDAEIAAKKTGKNRVVAAWEMRQA